MCERRLFVCALPVEPNSCGWVGVRGGGGGLVSCLNVIDSRERQGAGRTVGGACPPGGRHSPVATRKHGGGVPAP
jgi:hypothetical protein